MVSKNPDSNGKKRDYNLKTGNQFAFKPGETAADNRPKAVRELKQKVIDLKAVLISCLTAERLWFIAEQIIELAEAGNMEAATWIVDRCIGKPQKSLEITQADERSDEAPKVVLLDWRRQNDTSAESN